MDVFGDVGVNYFGVASPGQVYINSIGVTVKSIDMR